MSRNWKVQVRDAVRLLKTMMATYGAELGREERYDAEDIALQCLANSVYRLGQAASATADPTKASGSHFATTAEAVTSSAIAVAGGCAQLIDDLPEPYRAIAFNSAIETLRLAAARTTAPSDAASVH